MQRNVIKASTLFNSLLKFTLGNLLQWRYNVQGNTKILEGLKPPFIILSNHVNNLDPFFIGVYVKYPIHFVTSDEQYRNPIKGYFLRNLLGAIPKTKFISDIQTIRHILKLVKEKSVIGIFPEGKRNWNGVTGALMPATSKLIKLLKIPVVICVIEGAYLSHPRWALKDRFGKININFSTVLTKDSLATKSISEVHNLLEELLYHNEIAIQNKNPTPYRGSKIAEKLERFLFICPECLKISTMKSKNDSFFCTFCNYQVVYTELGKFISSKNSVIFSDPFLWDEWQLKYVNKLLHNKEEFNNEDIIFSDNKVNLFTGEKYQSLNKIHEGDLIICNNKFQFVAGENNIFEFNIIEINGLNIQYSNELEFYYRDRLYRFKFSDTGASAYKWTVVIQSLLHK